jgi:hypothetical protein
LSKNNLFFSTTSTKTHKKKMTKYIVVSGGVISGIGKGVIASSTGTLLKSLGLRVTAIKIDPYLNIDAGLMSPLDHGKVELDIKRRPTAAVDINTEYYYLFR